MTTTVIDLLCQTRGMRRWIIAIIGIATLALPIACSTSQHAEPTVPEIDFTPHSSISVDETGMSLDPQSNSEGQVPKGSVIEIRNTGKETHRIRGIRDSSKAGTIETVVFDTGIMNPGDTTTIVLTDTGKLSVRDVQLADQTLEIIVT